MKRLFVAIPALLAAAPALVLHPWDARAQTIPGYPSPPAQSRCSIPQPKPYFGAGPG